MSRDSVFQHALAFSLDERVKSIDDLLDSMVGPNSYAELTPAQERELTQRLEADRVDPGAAVPWGEAEKRIRLPLASRISR